MFPIALYGKLILFLSYISISTSLQCEKEDSWSGGVGEILTCPGLGDSFNERYCCGPKWARYCCSNDNLDDFDDWVQDSSYGIMRLVGAIVGCLFFLCLFSVVCCCCCCPCCWLAKRRTRGTVHGPSSAPLNPPVLQPKTQTIYNMQPPSNQSYPPQNQSYVPQNQSYPPQQPGYPPQQGYPSQPGYSQQPPMSYGYPPQDPGYPPAQPPPYPGPPQTQDCKPPPFNPNAS